MNHCCHNCAHWHPTNRIPSTPTRKAVCGICEATGEIKASHETCKWWARLEAIDTRAGRQPGPLDGTYEDMPTVSEE